MFVNDNLKLLYVWIEDYKNIKETGFHFSNEYKFEVKKENDNYNISKKETKSTNFNLFGNSINITAIIGKNGCGKSSIFEIIYMLTKKNCSTNAFLLFNFDNKLYYLKSKNINIKFQFPVNELDNDNKNLLFHSPIFKPYKNPEKKYNSYNFTQSIKSGIQDKLNKGFYYDRFNENETSYILGNTFSGLQNTLLLTENPQLKFDSFRWEFEVQFNYEYLIDRLQRSLSSMNNDYNYKYPNGSIVFSRIDNGIKNVFLRLIDEICPYTKNMPYESTKKNIYEKIIPNMLFLSSIFELDEFINAVFEKANKEFTTKYSSTNNKEEFIKNMNSPQIPTTEFIQKCIDDYKLKSPTLDNMLDTIIKILDSNDLKYNKYIKTTQYIKYFKNFKKNLKNLEKSIKLLDDFFEYNQERDSFIMRDEYSLDINIFDKEKAIAIYLTNYDNEYKDLIETFSPNFLNQFFKINFFNKVNTEYTFNNLSNGEQRTLRFFADLAYVKKLNNSRYLYLIDEIDISFHPEWQRNVITYIIDLFKNNSDSVHIIIATHSPYVISDLTSDNIILLKQCIEEDKKKDKYKNKEIGECIIVEHGMEKTFASNIHTLLSKTFFMENTIGKFAETKIQEIVDYINSPKNATAPSKIKIEEIGSIINLISDDILRNILEKQLDRKINAETR